MKKDMECIFLALLSLSDISGRICPRCGVVLPSLRLTTFCCSAGYLGHFWCGTVRSREVTNVLVFASCDTFLLGADLVADLNMWLAEVDIF